MLLVITIIYGVNIKEKITRHKNIKIGELEVRCNFEI